MFSPTGCLTTFPSNGRVEDTFLRFVDRPDEQRGGPIRNEEYLSRRLKQLKVERETLERVVKYFYPSSISPSLCMSVLVHTSMIVVGSFLASVCSCVDTSVLKFVIVALTFSPDIFLMRPFFV
ncbi:uncharacterized protein LOC111370412 isoform X2 [Olea europaea var. sylvestris]|nr:uncharacterized protein LOC111370412 isoform X2 [Olea europaea var. sylvestris]